MLCQAQIQHYNNISHANINGLKTLWKNLNSLISAGKRRTDHVKLIKVNYNCKFNTDVTDTSNAMNE